MNIDKTRLGVSLITFDRFEDMRGTFTKTFHAGVFTLNGLRHDFMECFHSVSAKHVIRGMHFQTPPHQVAKLIYVLSGKALDVVLDLKTRQYEAHELVAGKAIYVPENWYAHGFMALEDNTMMVYHQTGVYEEKSDKGVRYDSFGFCWGLKKAVVSARDWSLPTLEAYENSALDRWVG